MIVSNQTGKEKRKSPRKHCLVPVDGKQNSPFSDILTVDISKGGIGLITRSRLTLDQKIVIELDLDPSEEAVLVSGKVRWVRPVANSNHFRVGMTFSDVISGSKTRLNRYFKK